jgi:hypothetical protein
VEPIGRPCPKTNYLCIFVTRPVLNKFHDCGRQLLIPANKEKLKSVKQFNSIYL